jgi:hypothetical protein
VIFAKRQSEEKKTRLRDWNLSTAVRIVSSSTSGNLWHLLHWLDSEDNDENANGRIEQSFKSRLLYIFPD